MSIVGKINMITSAEEFIKLRASEKIEEYSRSAHEEAPNSVWLEVIEKYPEMRQWVALNKTIPVEIIFKIAEFEDEVVDRVLAMKRKTPTEILTKLKDSGLTPKNWNTV